MPSTPSTMRSTAAMSEISVRSISSPSRAGVSATRSDSRKTGYTPRSVSRSDRPIPPPAPVINTRCIAILLPTPSRRAPFVPRAGSQTNSYSNRYSAPLTSRRLPSLLRTILKVDAGGPAIADHR